MIVNLKFKFTRINDIYARYTGLAIDEPLEPSWWNVRPDQQLQTINGSSEVSRSIDFSDGTHTINVAVSSPSQYSWEVEIYADEILINSGTTNVGAFVSGTFSVGTTEEEKTEVIPAPIATGIDKLKNLWQRFRSFLKPDESTEAYK